MSTESKAKLWIFPLVVIVLHATFLYGMGDWLWERDHYQHFPLIILGGIGLAWYRLRGQEWPGRCFLSIRVIAYAGISALLFLAAAFTHSNWIGTLSFLGLLWTAIWFCGGPVIADQLRGPMVFLMLVVPFPLKIDQEIIIELQKLATTAASGLLDLMGDIRLRHIRSGVAIRTVDKSFMVEEACSGIHSLFSCVVAMAFWCICFRYSLLRLVATIGQTVVWVVFANCLRVFLIVYAYARFGAALDVGWKHEALGMATYAMSLGLALSMDQLIRFVFPLSGRSLLTILADGDEVKKNPDLVDSKLLKFLNSVTKRLNRAILKPKPSLIAGLVFLGVVYVPLFAQAHAHLIMQDSKPDRENFVTSLNDLVNDDLIAGKIGDWEVIRVRKVTRDADDPLGTNSVVWTLAGNGLNVQFTVDGYYPEWHDLSYCYTAMDWQLESAQNLQLFASGKTTELNLYKESGDFAVSLFSCYEEDGCVPVEPDEASGSATRNLLNRIRSLNLFPDQRPEVKGPVFQTQLWIDRKEALLLHERRSVRKLYVALTRQILGHIQQSTESDSEGAGQQPGTAEGAE